MIFFKPNINIPLLASQTYIIIKYNATFFFSLPPYYNLFYTLNSHPSSSLPFVCRFPAWY